MNRWNHISRPLGFDGSTAHRCARAPARSTALAAGLLTSAFACAQPAGVSVDDFGTGFARTPGNETTRFEADSLWPAVPPDADTLRVVEGDILYAPQVHGRALVVDRASLRWRDGVIPYVIDDALPDGSVTQIGAAIEQWNRLSTISLVRREGLSPSIARDFLRFQPGPGCASWVGRQGGEQAVWVAPSCTTGSLLHEIGHAIGLEHEHTRPDRDQYIRIHWENIDPDKRHNFDTSPRLADTHGGYDYDSIMHYGPTFFSKNGEPTIEALLSTSGQLGQRRTPSIGDLAAVDALYATDLALAYDIADARSEGSTISLHASVLQDQGTHDLELHVSLAQGRIVAQDEASAWDCESEADSVRCTLDRLSAGSRESLILQTDRHVSTDDVSAWLDSAALDPDPANDGRMLRDGADLEPALISAPTRQRTNGGAAGDQSGAAGPGLTLLLMLCVRGWLGARGTRIRSVR